MGLRRAGFDVTGVDIKPQPRYCGDAFIQGDALEADLSGFDFVWASPPCQAFSVASASQKKRGAVYPNLIPATRDKLAKSGLIYIIENVPGAPIRGDVMLCGSMFGLCLVRHRYFETNWPELILTRPCQHDILPVTVCGHGTPSGVRKRMKGSGVFTSKEKRDAMGIDWMNRAELSQSIPPAYSEFLAKPIVRYLTQRAKSNSTPLPER